MDATASGKCKLARPAKRQRKPKNLQEIEAGKVPIYGAKVVPIRIVISHAESTFLRAVGEKISPKT